MCNGGTSKSKSAEAFRLSTVRSVGASASTATRTWDNERLPVQMTQNKRPQENATLPRVGRREGAKLLEVPDLQRDKRRGKISAHSLDGAKQNATFGLIELRSPRPTHGRRQVRAGSGGRVHWDTGCRGCRGSRPIRGPGPIREDFGGPLVSGRRFRPRPRIRARSISRTHHGRCSKWSPA
jgi:hypothetical protein